MGRGNREASLRRRVMLGLGGHSGETLVWGKRTVPEKLQGRDKDISSGWKEGKNTLRRRSRRVRHRRRSGTQNRYGVYARGVSDGGE